MIAEMREGGKKYLKKHPKAFGGGIESETGIRRTPSGKRISVTTPKEEAAGVKPITVEEAKKIKAAPPVPPVVAKRIEPAKYITTDKTAGALSLYQQKYIESLKAAPTADLGVGAYPGVRLPYGEKDITWYEPQFGTVTAEYPKGVRKVSLIEEMKLKEKITPTVSIPSMVLIQQEAEKISSNISSRLYTKYQAKVDTGEMTVTEAQREYKKSAETQFNIEWEKTKETKGFKKKLKESERFREIYKKAFSPEYKKELRLKRAEFAADIVAVGISTVVPPVGIGYFTGKGIYKASKGARKDIRVAEVSPSEDLIFPIYPKLIPSEQSKEAGASFLFAGISGIGYAGKIGSQITALRKAELIKKPWTVTSQELFKKGDTTYIGIRGSKTTGFASAEGKQMFPIKMGKEGTFKILAGKGKIDIRVVDFMKQGVYTQKESIIKGSMEFPLVGRGTVSPAFYRGEGWGIPFKKTKMYVTSGEAYITPSAWQDVSIKKGVKVSKFWSAFTRPSGKYIYTPTYEIKGTYIGEKTTHFTFGGLTRKKGEKMFFTAGELKKARLYPREWRFTGLFKPETFGETLIKDKVAVTKGFTIFEKTKPAVKYSDIYGKQVAKTIVKPAVKIPPKVVAEQFGATTFKVAEKIVLPTLKVSPSLALQFTTIAGITTRPAVRTKPILSYKAEYKMKDKTLTKQIPSLSTDISLSTKTLQDYAAITITKPKAEQIVKPIHKPIIAPPFMQPIPATPAIIGLPTGIGFGFMFGLPSMKAPGVAKKKQGYIPQAKSKGKWKSLSKQPMTRDAALGRMSRTVDNTLSAQGRIRKVKGKASTQTDPYFGSSSHKLRPYRIRKGVPIRMHNQFIEKRSFRVDKLGEQQGLRVAKYAKQRGWLASTKKKKVLKRKSPWLV